MSNAVTRADVEHFYDAYASRDPQRIGACLDEHVEWDVFGPMWVMQICGQWRGRAAVVERFTNLVPKLVTFKKFDRHRTLVDGDECATYGQITSLHCGSHRTISHRVAHFIRFRDGKIKSFSAIIDTLDAAEQFIGHRIDLGAGAAVDSGDLVTV